MVEYNDDVNERVTTIDCGLGRVTVVVRFVKKLLFKEAENRIYALMRQLRVTRNIEFGWDAITEVDFKSSY